MKRIAALTIVSALLLASCNQNPATPQNTPNAASPDAAAPSAELNGTLMNFDPTAPDFDPNRVVYDPRGLSREFQSLSLEDRPALATDPDPNYVPESGESNLEAQALNAWPVLEYGSTGDDVKALQYLLRDYQPNLLVDGTFGPDTRTAVVNFNNSNGLGKSGTVDARTWPKLIKSVSYGATNSNAVRAVQMYLRIPIDGSFGKQTLDAVNKFQNETHVGASNWVGPATWQALIAGGSITPAPQPPSTGDGSGIVATRPIPLTNLSGLEKSMAQVYNARGAYLEGLRKQYNIPPAVMAAVMLVESGSAAYTTDWASLKGRRMTIRFENHIFYNHWGRSSLTSFNNHYRYNSAEHWKGHLFRVNTSDAWRNVHTGSQSTEWEAFDLATRLSSTNSAANAISMGMGQIMGFNFAACKYSSPAAMYTGLQTGAKAQLDAIVNFMLNRKGMLAALQTGDFRTVAFLYNGSGQVDAYSSLIQARYNAYLSVMRKYPR